MLRERDAAMSAKEIQEAMTGRAPAITTVLTALDRLCRKGEVQRLGESARKMRFRAAFSGEEHASMTMLSALDDAGDRQAALLKFAGNLSPDDVALLRRAIDPATAPRSR